MSADANKALVRRQFELIGQGDAEGAAALWAERSWNHGREFTRADLVRVYRSLISLKESHTIHEMIAEGDWVAARTTCTGVHAATPDLPINHGIFSGIPVTGISYSNQHLHLFRVADGKLVQHWASRDDLGVAQQIGLDLKPAKG